MKQMFFFRALPILFFAQLGFSAPTMVGANTNAVYHLFRPVPKSNLQPMESDLLVATQSPRTVDAGHSILKIEGGVLFQQVANTGFFGLYFYDDVHYYFYLNSWKDIAVCYRLGIARKFEIQFDARTEAIDLIEPPL
ncbi:MAG: hypothetical protein JNM63_15925, partial [Spirochaetia bacterium]|nr:hypothetical protein [Spirochaetia bacterium]